MNFCVCRNCSNCKYRGYRDAEPYCIVIDKQISEVKICPNDYKNRDRYGNIVDEI